MSDPLICELFLKADQRFCHLIESAISQLLATYFTFTGSGTGFYWVDTGSGLEERTARDIQAAFTALRGSESWSLLLHPGEALEPAWNGIVMQVGVETDEAKAGMARMELSLSTLPEEHDRLILKQFLDAIEIVCDLLKPIYGWGGRKHGLFGVETAAVSVAELLRGAPQPIEWLNIFGPGSVDRLGIKPNSAIPAWRVLPTAWGGLIIVLAPSPDSVTRSLAEQVAELLGLPTAFS